MSTVKDLQHPSAFVGYLAPEYTGIEAARSKFDPGNRLP
jgi:hypothetical protein